MDDSLTRGTHLRGQDGPAGVLGAHGVCVELGRHGAGAQHLRRGVPAGIANEL